MKLINPTSIQDRNLMNTISNKINELHQSCDEGQFT